MVRRAPSSRASHGTSTHSLSQAQDSFMTSKSLELAQEAQVVLEEQPQIIDAVAQHCQAIDPGAEGITREALRIDPACFEDVRMHHAAAGDFEPAGVFADAAARA